jgi:hypothetical protein
VIFLGPSQTGRGKSLLRAVLVVFQFSLSIILIAGTFIVYLQLAYFQKKELGFSKEQTMISYKPFPWKWIQEDFSRGIFMMDHSTRLNARQQ